MLHYKKPPKTFIKPTLISPSNVAIPKDIGVGLMHVDGWKTVGEILKEYKLPFERK